MKLIPDKIKRLWHRTSRACVVATVFILLFTAGMVTAGYFNGAKYAGALTMVVLFLIHLLIGAGGGYSVLRLWYYRENPLIRRMAIYMHAAPIGAVMAIVLLFMSKGVRFTWKFSITLFAGTLLMDLVRVPFILYMTRGDDPHASTIPALPVATEPEPADMRAPS
jgi:uncharacterized membrane protein YeiH